MNWKFEKAVGIACGLRKVFYVITKTYKPFVVLNKFWILLDLREEINKNLAFSLDEKKNITWTIIFAGYILPNYINSNKLEKKQWT